MSTSVYLSHKFKVIHILLLPSLLPRLSPLTHFHPHPFERQLPITQLRKRTAQRWWGWKMESSACHVSWRVKSFLFHGVITLPFMTMLFFYCYVFVHFDTFFSDSDKYSHKLILVHYKFLATPNTIFLLKISFWTYLLYCDFYFAVRPACLYRLKK